MEKNPKSEFKERVFSDDIVGEYDEEGFFNTPNGSFWDPDGVYFNRNGVDKHGGYYDDNYQYIPGPGWDNYRNCYEDEEPPEGDDDEYMDDGGCDGEEDAIDAYFGNVKEDEIDDELNYVGAGDDIERINANKEEVDMLDEYENNNFNELSIKDNKKEDKKDEKKKEDIKEESKKEVTKKEESKKEDTKKEDKKEEKKEEDKKEEKKEEDKKEEKKEEVRRCKGLDALFANDAPKKPAKKVTKKVVKSGTSKSGTSKK